MTASLICPKRCHCLLRPSDVRSPLTAVATMWTAMAVMCWSLIVEGLSQIVYISFLYTKCITVKLLAKGQVWKGLVWKGLVWKHLTNIHKPPFIQKNSIFRQQFWFSTTANSSEEHVFCDDFSGTCFSISFNYHGYKLSLESSLREYPFAYLLHLVTDRLLRTEEL